MRHSNWIGRFSVALVCLSFAALLVPTIVSADEQGAAARVISAASGDAVIEMRVTAKYRMVMEGQEQEEEEISSVVNATVIEPSGLAVCALSQVDPSQSMKMRGEQEGMKVQADVTGVQYILGEGKEIPGKIVLRDEELDIAFIRPNEVQTTPFKAVDLNQAASPQVMDELVVLGRLSEAVNRASYVAMDRITAIATKPRTLYVAGIGTWVAGLGVPAFTLDGKIVGITVMRAIPSAAGSSEAGGADSMPVLLPAADILKVAKQVPATK